MLHVAFLVFLCYVTKSVQQSFNFIKLELFYIFFIDTLALQSNH